MSLRRALLLALAVTGCRPAAVSTANESTRALRQVRLPSGLTMGRSLVLVDLAQDARYRFAAPASLVQGLSSEDAGSVNSPAVRDLGESFTTVARANGWRPVPDSADYEIAIFVVTRTVMRREERTEAIPNADSNLPRCDASRGGNQPRCTNSTPPTTRTVFVSVPSVERRVFHILRRRDDGATRVWVHPVTDLPAVDANVARDLMRLFTVRGPG